MSSKYKFSDQDKLYFISFAVINWIDARLTGRAGIYPQRVQRHFDR